MRIVMRLFRKAGCVVPDVEKTVQIVPDYNPLDDVLTQEVKGSVEDVTRQMHTEDVRNFGRRQEVDISRKATRVLSQEELNEIQARRERAAKNRSRAEARRKQQERKKQLIRRRQKGTFDFIIVFTAFRCVVWIYYVSEFLCRQSGKRV